MRRGGGPMFAHFCFLKIASADSQKCATNPK
jgi:hypothetical protein